MTRPFRLVALALVLPAVWVAHASDQASAPELRFTPSESTQVVTFSIDKVIYKVPRNYIINMDDWSGGPQQLVVFRVTYPGFRPLDPSTRRCLEASVSFSGRECAPMDFIISRGYSVSDEKSFENRRDLFRSQVPKQLRSTGFEEYETGSDDARIVTFRKREGDHWLLFDCDHGVSFGTSNNGPFERAPCHLASRLPNGNELIYHFFEGQLAVIADKDIGIRRLIHQFETFNAEL